MQACHYLFLSCLQLPYPMSHYKCNKREYIQKFAGRKNAEMLVKPSPYLKEIKNFTFPLPYYTLKKAILINYMNIFKYKSFYHQLTIFTEKYSTYNITKISKKASF